MTLDDDIKIKLANALFNEKEISELCNGHFMLTINEINYCNLRLKSKCRFRFTRYEERKKYKCCLYNAYIKRFGEPNDKIKEYNLKK